MAATYGAPGHDFTLQTIMELQKSVGALGATITSLTQSVAEHTTKVDRIEDHLQKKIEDIGDKVSSMSHKIYAAGVVLAILVVIGGWMVNKSWELVSAIATPAIQQAVQHDLNSQNSAPPKQSAH
ncbi:MAG: hypothetical protein EPN46_03890 [Candidimonas sp.]|nr:MAG: hypothetical protein EPN77_09455 [Candidimonas sp.]TAM26797.1 MAG: hypothetical protein EPN62_00995 [Candidimonas sp.]TAM79268.1 MAG: hypothetical protein EPN46_03890 [Candidimonas sp.]